MKNSPSRAIICMRRDDRDGQHGYTWSRTGEAVIRLSTAGRLPGKAPGAIGKCKQPVLVAPVRAHHPGLGRAGAVRLEEDQGPVGGPGWVVTVSRRIAVRQRMPVAAIGVDDPDLAVLRFDARPERDPTAVGRP